MPNQQIDKSGDSMSIIQELLSPHAIHPFYTERDEHWRERRAISACLEAAGIYGEEAMFIEMEAMKKLGIYKPLPCEKR